MKRVAHSLARNIDKKFEEQISLGDTLVVGNEPEEEAELQDDIHRGKSEHHYCTSYQHLLCPTFSS